MTTQGNGSRAPKAVWHKKIVYTFCDICIRAVEQMFRPQSHFNKQGWEYVVKEFQKETGLNFGQKQLKNKWDALKRTYKSWKDLLRNETGLGWDTNKNTIDADDAWWEEKIKVNQSYADFRAAGVEPELEEKLDLMFSPIVATGEFAISPGCNLNVTPREQQVDVEGSGDSGECIPLENSLDPMFDGVGNQPELTTSKRKSVNARGCAKSNIPLKKEKKETKSDILVKHIGTLVSAVASRSSTVTSKVKEPEIPSIRATVADIKTIPEMDINSDLFMFATEFVRDKERREIYLELETPSHKYNWLNYYFTHQ